MNFKVSLGFSFFLQLLTDVLVKLAISVKPWIYNYDNNAKYFGADQCLLPP